jgi:hypothetical protein
MLLFFIASRPVQVDPGAHPASYAMHTGYAYTRTKWSGHVASHSPPYSAEVNNGRSISLVPHMSSDHGVELIKDGDNFTPILHNINLLL